MLFIIKTIFSGLIIAFAAWLAGRRPILAGFIVSLPLISMLSILLSYAEYRDMEKINQLAVSILVAVPLSLTFFIPFVLNKWIRLNFSWTYIIALGCLAVAYVIHAAIFNKV